MNCCREDIAQRLILLRGKRTREEVAKAVGISLSAMAMYENGYRIPRDETKIKLANYYGVSVEQIFLIINDTYRVIDCKRKKDGRKTRWGEKQIFLYYNQLKGGVHPCLNTVLRNSVKMSKSV